MKKKTGCSKFHRLSQSKFEKKNTLRNYSYILGYFQIKFGEREIESITPDEILTKLIGPN